MSEIHPAEPRVRKVYPQGFPVHVPVQTSLTRTILAEPRMWMGVIGGGLLSVATQWLLEGRPQFAAVNYANGFVAGAIVGVVFEVLDPRLSLLRRFVKVDKIPDNEKSLFFNGAAD